MTCEDVLLRLWEYLDQELAREEASAVWKHIQSCSRCHPRYCCDRAFLALLARQRFACRAPARLVSSVRGLRGEPF